jgi:hypothetical protein
MSARQEFGSLPDYESDKAALERAGKKEVLKVCLPALSDFCSSVPWCHHLHPYGAVIDLENY